MSEITRPSQRVERSRPRQRRRRPRLLIVLVVVVIIYFFAPFRTNLLLLGTDDSPERGIVGRTDTMILATVVPLRPYVGLLSIPRDLWVMVPGVGEQRINTAYFFAEANEPGAGPAAAAQTIRENFGVPVRYFAVIHMLGLVDVIDAVGGVEVHLDATLGGWPAGTHHFDGTTALAFARDRSSGDDFGRMLRGQILLSAVLGRVLPPANWSNVPGFIVSLTRVIDTNVPVWQWPRLFFALLRALVFGVDSRTIAREMVNPFQTSGGAQVLAPNWESIRPVLREMFGR